jgi:hypothetical protein
MLGVVLLLSFVLGDATTVPQIRCSICLIVLPFCLQLVLFLVE